MIDTHCHLTFPDFEGKIDHTMATAHAAGVTGAITISTTTRDCLDALAVAKLYENVWCSSGIHPLYSDDQAEPGRGREGGGHIWENLLKVARDPKCVAWGELGLDNHYPEPARDVQRRVLDHHLAFIEAHNHGGPDGIGKPAGLPIIIHCREAFEDLIPILGRTRLAPDRFVFHCFTGTTANVRAILDFGAWVSFTGVLTYPNAGEVREAAAMVPADRIMVETDAPFLPPVPHRGKRPCEPAWVRHTLEVLAVCRGVSFDEMHKQVNQNTARFFEIPV